LNRLASRFLKCALEENKAAVASFSNRCRDKSTTQSRRLRRNDENRVIKVFIVALQNDPVHGDVVRRRSNGLAVLAWRHVNIRWLATKLRPSACAQPTLNASRLESATLLTRTRTLALALGSASSESVTS
jgi:hypothetical protein